MLGSGARPAGIRQRGHRRRAGDFSLGDFVRTSSAHGGAFGNNSGFLIAGSEDFLSGQRLCVRGTEGGVSPHNGSPDGKFDHAPRLASA